jgi:hypothetical protein
MMTKDEPDTGDALYNDVQEVWAAPGAPMGLH